MSECVIPTLTSPEVVKSKSVLPVGWKADLSNLKNLDLELTVTELLRRTTSRLPQDVIASWKGSGPGWQTRMAEVLERRKPRARKSAG